MHAFLRVGASRLRGPPRFREYLSSRLRTQSGSPRPRPGSDARCPASLAVRSSPQPKAAGSNPAGRAQSFRDSASPPRSTPSSVPAASLWRAARSRGIGNRRTPRSEGPWNAEALANPSNRSTLECGMPRDRCLRAVRRIHPDIVIAAHGGEESIHDCAGVARDRDDSRRASTRGRELAQQLRV